MFSQRKPLETAKQMLHQGRGETELPEMDWDYYGVHAQAGEQPQQIKGVHNPGRIRCEEKKFPKRAASTNLEGESYSRSYGTFGLSSVENRYSCENIQRRHEPPLCGCPNCEGPLFD